jgi:16S rRNA (guanine966-N2)-methyltransferase
MRVVTGLVKGRKLIALEGDDVRPTTDMVKEAIFDIIQFEVEGRRVLDLFAGSGQLGIEALSRGAAYCIFVDKNSSAVKVIRENLSHNGLEANARVVSMDSMDFLNGRDEFDIIFLDPPYSRKILDMVLPKASTKVSKSGMMICECDKFDVLPQKAGEFILAKSYKYGRTKVAIYRHEGSENRDNSSISG